MLVLTRREGQGVAIGGGLIQVKIAELRKHDGRINSVRLAIDAPVALPIHRDEVLVSILSESDAVKAHRRGIYKPGPVTVMLTERADTLAIRFTDAQAAQDALASGVIVFEGVDA